MEEIGIIFCEGCPGFESISRRCVMGFSIPCDINAERIQRTFALVAQAIANGKIKLPREIWRADYDGYLCDWTIDGSLDNTTPEIEEPIRRWQGRLIALGP